MTELGCMIVTVNIAMQAQSQEWLDLVFSIFWTFKACLAHVDPKLDKIASLYAENDTFVVLHPNEDVSNFHFSLLYPFVRRLLPL